MNSISKFNNILSDTMVMSKRVMSHAFRSTDTLITVIAMPLMFMIMFVYVFGGSIDTGSVDYINYVVPGITVMCIASGIAYTAARLNSDMTQGIIERFRSMPIAKSSILGGHVVTSLLFNAFSTIVIIVCAIVMGFRSDIGITGWLSIAGILLLFTLAMTWVAVMFGLLANSVEGASAFIYILMMLIFISPAFAPTDSMPKMVRIFAENQPMTPIIETVRALMMNEPVGNNAMLAVLWCIGISIAFYIGAMKVYKRKTS